MLSQKSIKGTVSQQLRGASVWLARLYKINKTTQVGDDIKGYGIS